MAACRFGDSRRQLCALEGFLKHGFLQMMPTAFSGDGVGVMAP